MKVLVPPLKIQGIKTKLILPIKNALDWDNKGIYFEPFMGSGVVGFNLAPKRAIFSDNNPSTKDKTSNWMISKRCFVDLLKAIFYYFFPSYIEIEAIIALIVEVIIEGGHKQIDYNLEYLMDNHLYPGYLVADNENFKLKNPYREKIDKIIKKYAEIDTVQQFLNPGIKGNDSNIDSFSDLLIDYLEEIRIAKSNYEASKPIPV